MAARVVKSIGFNRPECCPFRSKTSRPQKDESPIKSSSRDGRVESNFMAFLGPGGEETGSEQRRENHGKRSATRYYGIFWRAGRRREEGRGGREGQERVGAPPAAIFLFIRAVFSMTNESGTSHNWSICVLSLSHAASENQMRDQRCCVQNGRPFIAALGSGWSQASIQRSASREFCVLRPLFIIRCSFQRCWCWVKVFKANNWRGTVSPYHDEN